MRNPLGTLVAAALACGFNEAVCVPGIHRSVYPLWNPEDDKAQSHDLMVQLRLNVKFGRFGICVKQTGTTHRLEDKLRAKEYEDYGYEGMDAGQLMRHLLVRAAATMPPQTTKQASTPTKL